MKWDRVIVHPAEFIFPEKTIHERDLPNGHILREVESKGIPAALSQHYMELVNGTRTLADAHKIGQRWSVAIRAIEWPHKIEEHRFRLRKPEAIAALESAIGEK